MTAPRILLVEDDEDLAEGLADALELSGFRTDRAADGVRGLEKAAAGGYDLVVLDVMLPELSGFHVVQRLRRCGSTVPVLMLTARSQEIDKVRGLRQGADDYLTKPFGMMELVARVEALLRRARPDGRRLRLEARELTVDFDARRAERRGREISLTPREFQILELLSERRGRAVSRDELIGRLWGLAEDVEVSTRTIDQHVVALRRKLGDDSRAPTVIETVYGYGYRLAGPAASS